MEREKTDFATALKQAQDLGYAEKNPAADVEGMDTCRKISILSSIAFGKTINPEEVHCEGITSITLEDINNAQNLGYTIKLLGNSTRLKDGRVDIITAPYLVSYSHQLSHVNDVYNAIGVVGNLVGDVMFYGKGAGSLATASAVVADVLDIIANRERRSICWENKNADFIVPSEQSLSVSYIRTTASRECVQALFSNVKLYESESGLYFTTVETTEQKLKTALSKLDGD
jgi:homoserine dehydrogenase